MSETRPAMGGAGGRWAKRGQAVQEKIEKEKLEKEEAERQAAEAASQSSLWGKFKAVAVSNDDKPQEGGVVSANLPDSQEKKEGEEENSGGGGLWGKVMTATGISATHDGPGKVKL